MNDNGTPQVWKLGVVSYLNARPLIAGLNIDPSVKLTLDVPSRLAPRLDAGEFDAALVPVIDLFREDRDWRVISDACIGCDGETFTVRVFSRVPPQSLERLYVDGESHTSVALATILWHEMFGRSLTIIPLAPHSDLQSAEAVLLIGDKVVTNRPSGFEIEADLGQLWKWRTGLPFVFAAWAAPTALSDFDVLAAKLSAARDLGVSTAELIAADIGPGMGWPVSLAKRYLTSRLKFTLGPRQRMGMAKFLELAKRYDLVSRSRELTYA